MHRSVRLPVAAATLVLASVGLGGCGDDGGTAGDAGADSADTSETAPLAPGRPVAEALTVTSPAFADGEAIPAEFTCDGADTRPTLVVDGIDEQTVELAVVVLDPDAPDGPFAHWVVSGLPPAGELAGDTLPEGAIEGVNGAGTTGWIGPCPPPADDAHRYEFRVWALASPPDVAPGANADELQAALGESVLGAAVLVGTYDR